MTTEWQAFWTVIELLVAILILSLFAEFLPESWWKVFLGAGIGFLVCQTTSQIWKNRKERRN
jgi:hypothetical protein